MIFNMITPSAIMLPVEVRAEVTAYTISMEDCGKVDGITASGKNLSRGMIAAPKEIGFGTKIEINGVTYVVEDRGGAIKIKDNGVFIIDLYLPTKRDVDNWGRRKMNIKIFREANEMEQVLLILDRIANTSSRNEKEEILKENINNENLKRVLEYSLNPFKVYGIGDKSFDKPYNFEFTKAHTDIIDLLDYLLINNTGNESDKYSVNNFISKQPLQFKEWYKRIILKDLKIGISEVTINKIWKNLIPTFNVQLANPFSKFFDNMAAEVKIDGVRCLAIKSNGTVNMFTRNGKKLEGFNDIEKQLLSLPIDGVFDGEIIGTSYTNTMNNLFAKTSGKRATYMIFDLLTYEEFYAGESKYDYYTRKKSISNLKLSINLPEFNSLQFITPLEILNKPTLEQLTELTNKAVSMGFEGIVVKALDSKYKSKRNNDWQKLKPFESDEFSIIGFESGTGKYSDTLGKVLINSNGTTVRVGSGFSDNQRNEIWLNKEQYLGALIEVQYQEKIEKTGSLRFPTVKSIRLDK